MASGDSALIINGITMDVDTVDMFSLYDVIREDLKIMEQLSAHGLAVSTVLNVGQHDLLMATSLYRSTRPNFLPAYLNVS